MNKIKSVLLSAGIALALGFVFSCSSDDGGGVVDPVILSSSSLRQKSSSSLSSSSMRSSNSNGSSSSVGSSSSSSVVRSSSSNGSNSSSSVVRSSSSNGSSSSSFSAQSSSSNGSSSSSVGSSSSSSVQSSSSVPKCNGQNYTPPNQRCENNVVETKCGTNWYNAANTNLRCQSSIVESKCGSSWYNPSTQSCSDGTVFITDSRDGQVYKTVAIGTQVWMARNLNYNAIDSKCYGDDTGGDSQGNCAIYGRLYNWATAMNGAASSDRNPSGVKGICPSGSHLPSKAEWDALITAVGGSSAAGTKLKSTSGWKNNRNGNDNYGFAALPGGEELDNGYFRDVGSYGYWRTATEQNGNNVVGWRMSDVSEGTLSIASSKGSLWSVRCIKD